MTRGAVKGSFNLGKRDAARFAKLLASPPFPDRRVLSKSAAKPCPFCGWQPILILWPYAPAPAPLVSVGCTGLHCAVKPQVMDTDRLRALATWNRRAPKPRKRGRA